MLYGRRTHWSLVILLAGLLSACVDPADLALQSTVDILVVDGTITNLAETQLIKINRSRADPLTGRFGTLPSTKAHVQVIVDSSLVVDCQETVDGTYQLPGDFRGQVGHVYQLRFTLSDGDQYVSSHQIMPAVPPISKVSARFNPSSLSPQQLGGYMAGHDVRLESQDPIDTHNYYRWEWTLYERQYWCRSCTQGVYSVAAILPGAYKDRDYFVTGKETYEDCFSPPAGMARFDAPDVPKDYWIYDYPCRSACWQIIYGYDIQVFDDQYTNGGLISRTDVAHIPFYNSQAALVDVRQLSLTADAYRYYNLFASQSQNTGGLADTPPTAMAGNIVNVSNKQRGVVGYFTASAVAVVHYWLDRRDTQGTSYGASDPIGPHSNTGDDLFYALVRRRPTPEPPPPYQGGRDVPKIRLWPNTDRPPNAPCLQADDRTPFKPTSWRD